MGETKHWAQAGVGAYSSSAAHPLLSLQLYSDFAMQVALSDSLLVCGMTPMDTAQSGEVSFMAVSIGGQRVMLGVVK